MEAYMLEWLASCLGKPFDWLIGISPISFSEWPKSRSGEDPHWRVCLKYLNTNINSHTFT